MTFRKSWTILALVVSAVLVSSCETTGSNPGETAATATQSGPINATGFLKTDYEPLRKWLDERFEVDYKHMTPQLIFDQLPLNDIFYETVNLPSGPPLNFASADVSRRELLKKISQHWNLKMSFVMDESGRPTAVRVQG